MKASEKKAIESWAAKLSDAELENAYYDAAYASLGSQAEEMYERGYDIADIREQEALEKYQREKTRLLESLCAARGIRLWEERQEAPEDAPVRLIDANAEKAKADVIINNLIFGDEDEEMLEFISTLRQLLHTAFDEAPTVDAVEVVRCKDCVWADIGENDCESWAYCTAFARNVQEEHFCSYGERKDGEQNAAD